MSQYDDQIARLGFEAWADNQFTNSIENYVFPGDGNVTIEGKDYTQRVWWTPEFIHFFIRCYTKDGWKEASRTIKNDVKR
jgi:hypothetical protein